jgi:hypothetical protein
LILGLTQEKAALVTEFASLGLWWLAQITRLQLPRSTIRGEVENSFTLEITIPGAVLADFLAGGENHGVVLFLDLTLELALRRPLQYQRKGIDLSSELHQGAISIPQRLGKTDGSNRVGHRQILLQVN